MKNLKPVHVTVTGRIGKEIKGERIQFDKTPDIINVQ